MRFGKIPYLERVIQGSLSQLNFIMKEFQKTVKEMKLEASYTTYKSWALPLISLLADVVTYDVFADGYMNALI